MKINREAIEGRDGGCLLSEIFGVSEERSVEVLKSVGTCGTEESLIAMADILESELPEGEKFLAAYGAGVVQGQLNVYDKFGLLSRE